MVTEEQALQSIKLTDLRDRARIALESEGYHYGGSRKHGVWFIAPDGVNTVSVPHTSGDRRVVQNIDAQFRRYAAPTTLNGNGNRPDPKKFGNNSQAKALGDKSMLIIECLVMQGEPMIPHQVAAMTGLELDYTRHQMLRLCEGGHIIRVGNTKAPGDNRIGGRPVNIYAHKGYIQPIKSTPQPIVLAPVESIPASEPSPASPVKNRVERGSWRKMLAVLKEYGEPIDVYSLADLCGYPSGTVSSFLSHRAGRNGDVAKVGRVKPTPEHSNGLTLWQYVGEAREERVEIKPEAYHIPEDEPHDDVPVDEPHDEETWDPEDRVLLTPKAVEEAPVVVEFQRDLMGFPPSFWSDIFMGISMAFENLSSLPRRGRA